MFGHVERMNGEQLTKRVCESKVEGKDERKPRASWLDGGKETCEFTGAERSEGEVHGHRAGEGDCELYKWRY